MTLRTDLGTDCSQCCAGNVLWRIRRRKLGLLPSSARREGKPLASGDALHLRHWYNSLLLHTGFWFPGHAHPLLTACFSQVGPFIVGALIRVTSESYTTAFELFGLLDTRLHRHHTQTRLRLTDTLFLQPVFPFSRVSCSTCAPRLIHASGSLERRSTEMRQAMQMTPRFWEMHRVAQTPILPLLHRSTPSRNRHGCWGAHAIGCSSRLQPCTYCSTSRLRQPSGAISQHTHTSLEWARSSHRHTSALVRLFDCSFFYHGHPHDTVCMPQCSGAASVWDEVSRSSFPPGSRRARCASLG